ncbi:serine/threonine-protein kinase [Streptomyces sp. AP-93]|uniref:serine/threonine-protein kinase n=1 Tax=Streptomyces sp. AP-93 TaxID=2929048 RepID=UPI001FAF5778|nr:serine/threonine-protein kinase [Streptomyces sp. AP-93]MCJ0868136.1 protein kinase [Streptomyces sp. AP-93]
MRGELLGGRYRLGERLGGGGMGEVWAAEDVRMRRAVAAKLVDAVPGRYGDQVERRFVHEVRSAANLPHRHTVTVHDCGEDVVAGRRTLYLVMEHVDGRDLRAVFHSGPRPAWHEVADWAGQIGSALVAAHAHGILHRDIKPQNAMLTGEGVVKVLDFGLAKILRESLRLGELTAGGTALGTLPYMSPEQCRGDRGIDHRTDLYSLGCLLYEGFTGRPPFTNPAPHALLRQQLYEAPRPLTARNAPGVPPGIADLVASLLAKDPAHRPPDAATVVARLRAELPDPGPGPGPQPRTAAADEAAAELLRRTEREAGELRARVERDVRRVREQAAEDVAAARATARRMLDEAQANAIGLLEHAKERADALLRETEKDAVRLLDEARARADRLASAPARPQP